MENFEKYFDLEDNRIQLEEDLRRDEQDIDLLNFDELPLDEEEF